MNVINLRRLISHEIKTILLRTTSEGILEESVNSPIHDAAILCGSFNPLHEGHKQLLEAAWHRSGKKEMIYEISVFNCDKGDLDEKILLRRIKQFHDLKYTLLLTNQPYFYQKTETLNNCCFVVGFDTFIRLIDVKYSNHDMEQLRDIFKVFQNTQTTFIVAGRFNPMKKTFE